MDTDDPADVSDTEDHHIVLYADYLLFYLAITNHQDFGILQDDIPL